MGIAVLYVLLSATSFALNQASVRRGMLTGSALQGVYTSAWIGVAFLILAAAASTQLFDAAELPARSYLLLGVAGVNHFILGRYCNFRAVGALGANRARAVIEINLPYSVLLAIPLLSETVTPLMWGGMALVMAGPLVVLRRQAPRRAPAAEHDRTPATSAAVQGGSDPTVAAPVEGGPPTESLNQGPPVKYAEGYLFGVLNAVSFGTSPLLIRSALADSGLGILGSLVAYAAAATVLIPVLVLPSVRRNLGGLDRLSGRWFMVGALAVVVAQMFRYMALSVAPVTVVAPLLRAGGLVLLPVSFLVNRQTESFEPRVLIAIAISLAGSLLIVL